MTPLRARHWIVAAATALTLGGCGTGFDDPGPVSWHAPGAYPQVMYDGEKMQCVPFARSRSGIQIWGDAVTWWDKAEDRFDRTSEPERGAVMVMRGYDSDDRAHVAVVRRVLNEREIVVDHANWLNSGEVGLDMPVMDVSDDNDWSEVRVWYAPGRHYGGRVYEVTGFIVDPSAGQRMAFR
jgi:surface antigen